MAAYIMRLQPGINDSAGGWPDRGIALVVPQSGNRVAQAYQYIHEPYSPWPGTSKLEFDQSSDDVRDPKVQQQVIRNVR